MHDVTAANVGVHNMAFSVHRYSQWQALMPAEARLIGKAFPAPSARVLDLGCGAGRTTDILARQGYNVVGIDLSDALLMAARRQSPDLDVRHMDATALDFPNASFDAAIFSYNGLDYIYPLAMRERCLREVRRVLKPGAPFILSSHNVVGASFSGGFLYATGYWNAMRFAWRQLLNPLAREWYLVYVDEGGTQHLYSAPPSRTVAQLGAAGFARVTLSGRSGTDDPQRLFWREAHIQYLAWAP